MSQSTEQESVIRVRRALQLLGARGEVRALDDSARTAKEAAVALGIDVGQIANSLIFLADGEPVLVMASGGHRVDTMSLAMALDVDHVDKADADQVRKATPERWSGNGWRSPCRRRPRSAPAGNRGWSARSTAPSHHDAAILPIHTAPDERRNARSSGYPASTTFP